jgi:hypothetical protein
VLSQDLHCPRAQLFPLAKAMLEFPLPFSDIRRVESIVAIDIDCSF